MEADRLGASPPQAPATGHDGVWWASVYRENDGRQFLSPWCASDIWVRRPANIKRIATIRCRYK